jgi:hypothetical protein
MSGKANEPRDKSEKAQRAGLGRREFFGIAGAGASLVAAGAAALVGNANADSESNDEKRKARYRVTEHIKNYYRVNRYPG